MNIQIINNEYNKFISFFFAGQQRTFSKFGLEKVQQKIPRILSKLMDSVHWTQIEKIYKILKPEKDTQFCLQNFIRPNFYNLIFIMPVYGAVCVSYIGRRIRSIEQSFTLVKYTNLFLQKKTNSLRLI